MEEVQLRILIILIKWMIEQGNDSKRDEHVAKLNWEEPIEDMLKEHTEKTLWSSN